MLVSKSNLLPLRNYKNTGNEMVTDRVACNRLETNGCKVTAALHLISGRWKCIILYHLTSGTRRFGEIAARIPEISRKVLTEQLKELEKDGLVTRKQYNEVPLRVEYSLTTLGQSLTPVFNEIAKWSSEHITFSGDKKPVGKKRVSAA